MADITIVTIVFMGFINQRSHHWGAPSDFFPGFSINEHRACRELGRTVSWGYFTQSMGLGILEISLVNTSFDELKIFQLCHQDTESMFDFHI